MQSCSSHRGQSRRCKSTYVASKSNIQMCSGAFTLQVRTECAALGSYRVTLSTSALVCKQRGHGSSAQVAGFLCSVRVVVSMLYHPQQHVLPTLRQTCLPQLRHRTCDGHGHVCCMIQTRSSCKICCCLTYQHYLCMPCYLRSKLARLLCTDSTAQKTDMVYAALGQHAPARAYRADASCLLSR